MIILVVITVKIYLDIVYLLNAYLGGLCLISISIIKDQVYSLKKILALSGLWGMNVLSLYIGEAFSLFMLILFVCLLDRHHPFKTAFLWLFILLTYLTVFQYLSINVTLFGLVLIADTTFDWWSSLVLGSIIVGIYILMLFGLHRQKKQRDLLFKVKIKKNEKIWEVRGFMDTGNQALYLGYPILFTHMLPVQMEEIIYLNGVGGKCAYPAMKVLIFFSGHWQKAYLAQMDTLLLDQAEILLNYELR